MKNTAKSWLLLATLGALLVWIGGAIGGRGGMILMLGFATAINFSAYWFSDRMVVKMTRARPVSESEAPWLYAIVRRLAAKGELPMPRLYIMPAAQPNAFATGRNPERAVVAVTEGILDVLDEDELEGVLAHELSHVGNRDILVGAVAATVAAAISMLARMAMWSAMLGGRDDRNNPLGAVGSLLAMILAPIAAFMIQMAVSRSREAQADATGAKLLGDATPLARALIKIDAAARNRPVPDVNPAVAHVFLQSPFRGGAGISKLFMSHPPLEERLAQLRSLGARI